MQTNVGDVQYPGPEWNETGYDLRRYDRWLYAFGAPGSRRVKIGLVLVEERLLPRLNEVRRTSKQPDLEMLACTKLESVTHEEAEHIESVVRHWLTGRAGFVYVGVVDWLDAPEGLQPTQWQETLDRAAQEAQRFGR